MDDMSDRYTDRRKKQIKFHHKNLRKTDRRREDQIDQNIYKTIMIVIPLVLILWALNIK